MLLIGESAPVDLRVAIQIDAREYGLQQLPEATSVRFEERIEGGELLFLRDTLSVGNFVERPPPADAELHSYLPINISYSQGKLNMRKAKIRVARGARSCE